MQFIVTAYGESVLRASETPPTLGAFRLGNVGAYYLPDPEQVDIQGEIVYQGAPSAPIAQSANLLKYVVSVDGLTSPLTFNEVGLYMPNGMLFAVGTQDPPYVINGEPNRPRSSAIDCFVTVDQNEAFMYAELGNSADNLNAQAGGSVDLLPRAVEATPNLVIVPSPSDSSQSVLALSNNSLWSFSTHTELAFSGKVETPASVWLRSDEPGVKLSYHGELILQFVSGKNHGICRIISQYSPSTRTYQFSTPLAETPAVGDTFIILRATALRPTTAQLLAGLSPLLTPEKLNELVDNPLTSFLKADGSVALTGDLDLNNRRLRNVSYPSGPADGANKQYVDLHSGGSGGGGSINIEDYLSPSTPSPVADFGYVGDISLLSRADHRHAHGNLGGGNNHATATTSTAGFMSAEDKNALRSAIQRINEMVQTFNFANPSMSWLIEHNMGTVDLIVSIYNSNSEQELAPIQFIDDNSFRINFVEMRAGRAVVYFKLSDMPVPSAGAL